MKLYNNTIRFAFTLVAVGFLCGSANANLLLNGELTTPSGDNEAATNWVKVEPDVNNLGMPIDSVRLQKAQFADRSKGTIPAVPAPGPDGNPATNDLGGIWFRGFEGNNNNNPGITVDGLVWQDVAAGAGDYTLSFWEKHEFYFQAQSASVSMLFLSGGNSVLGSSVFDLLATPGTNLDSTMLEPWVKRTLLGTAPAGTASIRVLAQMRDGSDNKATAGFKPQGMLLDGFVLERVPEPASITMLFAGLVGLMGLRRQG